jgi:transposase
MSVAQLKELKTVITANAVANPTHLCAELAAQFGVSRSTMGKWLRALIDEGWITRQGSRSHPVYKPSVLRQVNRSYSLAAWTNKPRGSATLRRVLSCRPMWHAWPTMHSPSC